MFIAPIQQLNGLEGFSKIGSVSTDQQAGLPFKNMFQEILANVIETDAQVAQDVQAISTGQSDDLHNLTIDQTKAQLSIELMVQLRNRLMDSYNEIMRINL